MAASSACDRGHKGLVLQQFEGKTADTEIGQAFGLHYATVSRLVRVVEIESEVG